jgi:hypothetical protein
MGLDQYLFSGVIGGDGEDDELIGTWRKDNQIQGYFDNLAVERGVIADGESINAGDRLYLSNEDIKQLDDTVCFVLRGLGFDPEVQPDWDVLTDWQAGPLEEIIANDTLPPRGGFFFGAYEIDGWYVAGLYNTIKNLRDADGYGNIYYTAWW